MPDCLLPRCRGMTTDIMQLTGVRSRFVIHLAPLRGAPAPDGTGSVKIDFTCPLDRDVALGWLATDMDIAVAAHHQGQILPCMQ